MQAGGKEHEAVLKMLTAFPQLLGYNPTYLQVLCQRALRFLTSDERFAACVGDQDSKVSAHFIDHYEREGEVDLIADIVRRQCGHRNKESNSQHEIEVCLKLLLTELLCCSVMVITVS